MKFKNKIFLKNKLIFLLWKLLFKIFFGFDFFSLDIINQTIPWLFCLCSKWMAVLHNITMRCIWWVKWLRGFLFNSSISIYVWYLDLAPCESYLSSRWKQLQKRGDGWRWVDENEKKNIKKSNVLQIYPLIGFSFFNLSRPILY